MWMNWIWTEDVLSFLDIFERIVLMTFWDTTVRSKTGMEPRVQDVKLLKLCVEGRLLNIIC